MVGFYMPVISIICFIAVPKSGFWATLLVSPLIIAVMVWLVHLTNGSTRLMKIDKLNITRLPTARRARQPTPNETQSGASRVINAYRATRPAGKHFPFRGQALKKKLNGIGARDASDLMTHTNPAALVSA